MELLEQFLIIMYRWKLKYYNGCHQNIENEQNITHSTFLINYCINSNNYLYNFFQKIYYFLITIIIILNFINCIFISICPWITSIT